MNRIGILLLLIPFLAAVAVGTVTAQGLPAIISPQQGEVLQGTVTIRGSSTETGFQSFEVDFAYTGDTTGTWFLISQSSQAVDLGTLATWDTTTITDGNYDLRLRIILNDGTPLDVIISDLRVRNYTPIETPTPAPTVIKPTLTPTDTLTPTPFPSPTPLPVNPAVLTTLDISASLAYGGLGAVALIIIFGIYFWVRRNYR
ncbi:MAG: hypothetical protein ABSA01_04485 [Anaerolineales bacterium]|jgi:hypothetical protein